MTNILILHHNFPAQFKNLIPILLAHEADITFITDRDISLFESLPCRVFSTGYKGSAPSDPHSSIECATRFLKKAHELAKKNLFPTPEIIISHSGWGCGACMRELFPKAKHIAYLEWWFKSSDEEFTFTPPDYPWSAEYSQQTIIKQNLRNATQAIELLNADSIISPFRYQTKGIPKTLESKVQIIPDIVNYNKLKPDPKILSLTRDKVRVTFCSRGLEAMRGFPEFIIAATKIASEYPNVVFEIVGEDASFYQTKPLRKLEGESYMSWATSLIKESGLTNNFVFHGRIPYSKLIRLLQLSSLHVYLSRPFVVSWSLLDAMSCGIPVIASHTNAVAEAAHPDATFWTDHRSEESLVRDLRNAINSVSEPNPLVPYKLHGLPQRVLIKNRHKYLCIRDAWLSLCGIPVMP